MEKRWCFRNAAVCVCVCLECVSSEVMNFNLVVVVEAELNEAAAGR